ncbi:unnamed protein product [Caenorhabditis auriculariae]|uniref:Uncharacterized protein n=1 Tax=Caenorhabditis auriculariae TaxID=2777116 RepID=A0A8S1HFY7_9PELO|nr:unnamed protein product [Caenorhabditis auriculariae]
MEDLTMDETPRGSEASSSAEFSAAEGRRPFPNLFSANPNFLVDNSVRNLGELSSTRHANRLTNIFGKLTDSWNRLRKLNATVDCYENGWEKTLNEKMKFCENLSTAELLEFVRRQLEKEESTQRDLNFLNRKCQNLSERLNLAEGRVSRSQREVFDKMEGAIQEVLLDFQKVESDLMLKNSEAEQKLSDLTAKKESLQSQLADSKTEQARQLEHISSLTKTKDELKFQNDQLQAKLQELTEKYKNATEEMTQVQKAVEKLKSELSESRENSLKRENEVQRLRTVIIEEDGLKRERDLRHKEEIDVLTNSYRQELQRRLQDVHLSKEEHLEEMARSFREKESLWLQIKQDLDREIKQLSIKLKEEQDKVNHYESNFAMIRAQVKGQVRRELAQNYQKMFQRVGNDDDAGIPSPPSENPLVGLRRLAEKDSERDSRRKPLSSTSPRRNVAVQVREQPLTEQLVQLKPKVVKRSLPVSHRSGRL